MVNFILSHKIMTGVVGLLVAILVWIGLSSSAPSSNSLLNTESAIDAGPDRELVATLLALKAVKLDGSIFKDPVFQSLIDISQEIVPEPVGRPNPFAPLSGAVAGGASAKEAQIFAPTPAPKKK